MTKIKLILASSSPQRKKLLETIGITPDDIVPANIDETPKKMKSLKILLCECLKKKV